MAVMQWCSKYKCENRLGCCCCRIVVVGALCTVGSGRTVLQDSGGGC